MRTIKEYIEAAKKRHKIESDRQLALKLEISSQAVFNWRNDRGWPTDEAMVRLCRAAGMSEEKGLQELSYWRTAGRNEAEAAKVWKRIAQRAAPAIMLGAIVLTPDHALAHTANKATSDVSSLYIMRHLCVRERTVSAQARKRPCHREWLLKRKHPRTTATYIAMPRPRRHKDSC